MATDAQSLITSANGYNLSPGDVHLIKLGLLKAILLTSNPMADTSAQTLITSVKDYGSYGPGMWPLIELALLVLILNNGGGGTYAYAANYSGTTPNFTPANPAWAKDTSNNSLWFYDGTSWSEIIV